MSRFTAWFSLFASTSTLLCCALPSFLVVLGMGATMAGLVSTFPQLIWISQLKAWIFSGSGVMMSLAAYMHYQSRNQPCPIDPKKVKACASARKWSFVILTLSAALWSVGAFFAFIAPLILI